MVNVGDTVRATRLAGFPVGKVIDIGPELDTPKGDRFAYVQFRDWRVVPVLLSEVQVLDLRPLQERIAAMKAEQAVSTRVKKSGPVDSGIQSGF